MTNRYLRALLTSCLSILPILVIVLILSATPVVNFDKFTYGLFCVGGAILIIGLALFQIGADRGLTKVGQYMGASLSKQTNLFIVILFAFVLGALITCAEPSILIVLSDICNDMVSRYVLLAFISCGVGLFVVLGLIRVLKQKSLKVWYLFLYFIVFMIILILQIDPNKQQFLPFIFDAGGITTGSATVPFILSLGAGVAMVRSHKNSTEDSFGLVGMASIGPILTMTLYIMFANAGFGQYVFSKPVVGPDFMNEFVVAMLPGDVGHLGTLFEVLIALAPIIAIFLIYDIIFIKLPWKKLSSIFIGFIFSYLGLVLFLTGTNAAMGKVGRLVGIQLGLQPNWVIILLGFILGLVTILCEPAVHVLTGQIEDISDGRIKKRTVLIALSIGVGVAICLSVIRTLYRFSIMWYIVPGYLLSFALMFTVPNIYTAMAFDSGGTASGPMSTSFILPMIIGIAYTRYGEYDMTYNGYYQDAFGVVAMIALTPILAIQILGLTYQIKNKYASYIFEKKFSNSGSDEIIHF